MCPLLILPGPIIHFAPLRPEEVKGLAQSSTEGQKQNWDSNLNSREGPKASTPNHCDQSARNKAGHEDKGRRKVGMFQRPRTGPPGFSGPGPHPLLLAFLSISTLPGSCPGTPATPVLFHWFLRWRSVFRGLFVRALRTTCEMVGKTGLRGQ